MCEDQFGNLERENVLWGMIEPLGNIQLMCNPVFQVRTSFEGTGTLVCEPQAL